MPDASPGALGSSPLCGSGVNPASSNKALSGKRAPRVRVASLQVRQRPKMEPTEQCCGSQLFPFRETDPGVKDYVGGCR